MFDYKKINFLEIVFRGNKLTKSLYLSNDIRKKSLYGDSVSKSEALVAFEVNNYKKRYFNNQEFYDLKNLFEKEKELVETILDIEFEDEIVNHQSNRLKRRWLEKNKPKYKTYETDKYVSELLNTRNKIVETYLKKQKEIK